MVCSVILCHIFKEYNILDKVNHCNVILPFSMRGCGTVGHHPEDQLRLAGQHDGLLGNTVVKISHYFKENPEVQGTVVLDFSGPLLPCMVLLALNFSRL